MEYMLSFAQLNEDIILYHLLGGKEMPSNVFWIDVGANDPLFLSVTKFFSMRGRLSEN